MKRIASSLAGIVALLALGGVATAGSNASVEKVVYTTERYQLVPVEQGNVDADPPGTSLGESDGESERSPPPRAEGRLPQRLVHVHGRRPEARPHLLGGRPVPQRTGDAAGPHPIPVPERSPGLVQVRDHRWDGQLSRRAGLRAGRGWCFFDHLQPHHLSAGCLFEASAMSRGSERAVSEGTEPSV